MGLTGATEPIRPMSRWIWNLVETDKIYALTALPYLYPRGRL